MEKKKVPEDLRTEAMNIIRDCAEGSGAELRGRLEDLQNRFDRLCETCYEAKELCEEATADMQVRVGIGAVRKGEMYTSLPTLPSDVREK
jgi:predicted HAD superfamily phosphohydrolase